MVRLDEGRFPALELNNRRLSVKNSFCRKNGIYTRSVPSLAPFLQSSNAGLKSELELMDAVASLRRISRVSLFTPTLTAINNVGMFLLVFLHSSLSVFREEGGLEALRRCSQPPSAPLH